MMEVRATGRQSFRVLTLAYVGTGVMVVSLKHVGTTESEREGERERERERFKMSVNTPAS